MMQRCLTQAWVLKAASYNLKKAINLCINDKLITDAIQIRTIVHFNRFPYF
jgi:ABC-type enterochelin transport system ATPase subunit